MRKSITVLIPHSLTQAEAQRRIDEGFDELSQKMSPGGGCFVVTKSWSENRMRFVAKGLGQEIIGGLEVLHDAVRIEINLPEWLAKFASLIANGVETEGRKLLRGC